MDRPYVPGVAPRGVEARSGGRLSDGFTMSPKLATVLTRLGAGGPPIQAVLLTREMRKLGYRTALVAGSCAEQDGDMSYLLGAEDEVHWIPEMSRAV